MKIDVKVKNLGKLKEAEFRIRPMTVITGPNGTGKSFFTKVLYSIFNVINKNVYHESVSQTIRQIQLRLDVLIDNPDIHDLQVAEELKISLDNLQDGFKEASSWKIDDYLAFATSKVAAVEDILALYSSYLNELTNKSSKINSIKPLHSQAIKSSFDSVLLQLKNPQEHYANFLAIHFENELKDNFQISALTELIRFDEKKIEIEVDELLVIEIGIDQKLYIYLEENLIDEVTQFSSVVFFESPAYWKVREALKSAKIIDFVSH